MRADAMDRLWAIQMDIISINWQYAVVYADIGHL